MSLFFFNLDYTRFTPAQSCVQSAHETLPNQNRRRAQRTARIPAPQSTSDGRSAGNQTSDLRRLGAGQKRHHGAESLFHSIRLSIFRAASQARAQAKGKTS